MKNTACAFLLLSFFTIPMSQSWAQNIAKVMKIKGSATKLLPGSVEATQVSVGDELSEDTSIVTGPKSFIRVKFIDNSVMSIGADSKIVISEMSKDSPGIISLLKGRIRTEVEKLQGEEEHKFYVRTRTAAMGVRGTEFQTIYNPDNHVTSLLTYKGEVAIVKLDESTHNKLENQLSDRNTLVTRDAGTNAPIITTIPEKALSEKDEIMKALDKRDAVVVEAGQNSITSDHIKKATLPVNISPVQLNALYKNIDLDDKNILNVKPHNQNMALKNPLSVVDQKTPAEGFYNERTGEFAPKSGGFIDQVTGLYVSNANGVIDADTGQYVVPAGLTLDAKKGFILEKNAEVRPELLALKEDMNAAIAREKIVGAKESETIFYARSVNEKFIRNRLQIAFRAGSEDLKLNEDKDGARDPFNFESSKMMEFIALWQVNSTNRFAPILGLSYSSLDYDLKNRGSQDSKSLITMTAGLKYALTSRVDLVFKATLDQAHHASQTALNPDTYQLKRIVMTNLNFGGNFEVFRSNRFSLLAEAFGHLGLRKRFNNLVVSSISGWDFKITPQYAIDEKRTIGLGFFTEQESSKITGGVAFNQEKRTKSGVEVNMNFEL